MATQNPIVEPLNRLFIKLYKVFGFVALLGILAGLVSFFTLNLFYLFDRSWVAPMILSSSHEEVVKLSGQLVSQGAARDRLLGERARLEDDARDARRRLVFHDDLIAEHVRAVSGSVGHVDVELDELDALARTNRARTRALSEQRRAYGDYVERMLEEKQAAGLARRDELVEGRHRLSELVVSEVALDQRRVELDARRREVRAERDALSHLAGELGAAEPGADAPLTRDLLGLKQQHGLLVLDRERVADSLENLERQRALLTRSIEGYERVIAEIEGSPYMRAIEGDVTLAFAPYDNLGNISEGDPVYGCRFYLVGCRMVGRVVAPVDGEVSARHPLNNDDMRGLMVELELDRQRSAEDVALFIGGKPLWLL